MLNKLTTADRVPQLFPQVYRDDAPEFVEFVKAYHEHLESVLQLDYFKITDIDSTYNEFLKYFQRMFLKDLDVEQIGNQRLITKHIQDLYSRKGTEEGLRLLFTLFFNENIELFYPSVSLLSPSASEYYSNYYLEMESVQQPLDYDLQRGMRILGQTTGATGYVEEVIFKNFDGILSPLVFITNKRGEFTVDDVIIILDNEGNFFNYSSQKIKGSMSEIVFDSINQSSPDNLVGDEFNVVTKDLLKKPGRYGRVMAEEVTQASAGSITLNIAESGYGYTLPDVLVEGLITQSIDAQNLDANKVIFQPDQNQLNVPTKEQAIIFDGTIKYYTISSVEPVPNVFGNLNEDTYVIQVLNGFYADEGETIEVEISADPNIIDGTTVDVILSGDIDSSDIVGGDTVYQATIEDGKATVTFQIAEDNITDFVKEMFITLDVQDSANNFTGQPSVAVTVQDTSNPDTPNTVAENINYILTLDEPVEDDYFTGYPVKLVDAKTITNLYISNQVLVINNDTAVKFTLLEIADEIDRIAVGLTTPSDPSNADLVELFAYLKETNPKTKRQNGDINNSGSITESDSTYLRNAYAGNSASLTLISDRFDKWTNPNFSSLEKITYVDQGVTKTGYVVEYREPLLHISTSKYSAFPEGDETITAVREDGTTFDVTNVSAFNNSAKFELQSLGDFNEDIEIYTLKIQELSSTTISDIFATTLNDLSPTQTFTIGEVGNFKVIDSGFNYANETFLLLEQPFFSEFNKYDFYVEIENLSVVLFPGDQISQTVTSFLGNQYTAKGVFLRRDGNKYYFRSKSFYQFDADEPISIYNVLFEADSIIYDLSTSSMGKNAEINSTTRYGKGQITKVKILNCGYNYEDGSEINLVNDDGVVVATATVRSLGTGFSKGQWRTTSSNLNAEARVLQDSNYYQEFSFDIGSVTTPNKYQKIVRDVIQAAGTRMFSTPLINTNNNLGSDVTTEIAFFEIQKQPLITEDDRTSPIEALRGRYPEQKIQTQDSPFRADQPEDLVTVETLALTTLTI